MTGATTRLLHSRVLLAKNNYSGIRSLLQRKKANGKRAFNRKKRDYCQRGGTTTIHLFLAVVEALLLGLPELVFWLLPLPFDGERLRVKSCINRLKPFFVPDSASLYADCVSFHMLLNLVCTCLSIFRNVPEIPSLLFDSRSFVSVCFCSVSSSVIRSSLLLILVLSLPIFL